MTCYRWHFWCTEMHPSGKETAYRIPVQLFSDLTVNPQLLSRFATFANLKLQHGPTEAETEPVTPMFPDEKKKKYLSRKDQWLKEKQEVKSVSENCKHSWCPHFNGMVCSMSIFTFPCLTMYMLIRFFATNA
jgi:hypothetical protein